MGLYGNIFSGESKKKKVFLGGTCNESTWRNELIGKLFIDYFNPVVDDWTEECYQRELQERANSDFVLYVITPRMTGVYSIAEVIDDSNKQPEKTFFVFLREDNGFTFNEGQIKSLDKVGEMVKRNGGTYISGENVDMGVVAEVLNKKGGYNG